MSAVLRPPQLPVLDQHARPLRNLRLSVTDRCNLRCAYCMPEEHYNWLPKTRLLSFEEISRVVDAFCAAGVNHIRLTGGEPLLRRDLSSLIKLLAAKQALQDIALTTNGILLEAQAESLHEAGLQRVTISLDSLRPDRFHKITKRDDLEGVLRGVHRAAQQEFSSLKIDTVVMKGFNDDELGSLIDYGKTVGAEVRFIEYMDVGGATQWSMDDVMTRVEMLRALEASHGPVRAVDEQTSAPADRYQLADGTTFGIISSTTQPFCGSCNRSRLTADGHWFRCLYAREGTDLRAPLRAGASQSELTELIRPVWEKRSDRGAEERLGKENRSALAQGTELAGNPHLEMHTRGG